MSRYNSVIQDHRTKKLYHISDIELQKCQKMTKQIEQACHNFQLTIGMILQSKILRTAAPSLSNSSVDS
jgi:hypothetical protein